MVQLNISKGLDSIPTNTIPDDPAQFVNWFKSVGIKRWLANADVRNAVSGAGISITGNNASAATIAANSQVLALFNQPYVLVGTPVAPAVLTAYRSIAAQASVLSLTDGGVTGAITLGVAANGIGNTQIRQGAAASVVGNATALTANVADIAALADNTTLVRAAGVLSFSALPLAAVAAIGNNTVVGNISGGALAPVALSQTQLTALINVATASLSGALPVLSGTATQFLNGAGNWVTPAYPIGANPSATIGLTANNGSAATFMRSDGTPALGVGIAPTWTGNHIFTPASGAGPVINQFQAGVGLSVRAASTYQANLYITGNGATDTTTGFALQQDNTNTAYVWNAANAAMYFGTNNATAMSIAASGALTCVKAIGVNNVSPPAQVTGWGTPTGPAVVANFSGSAATLVNCSNAIAKIITDLKALGFYAA